jgi:hypothetical protein
MNTASLTIDPALLTSPEAQQARARGLLEVKQAAARRAERLAWLARPLLVAVVAVSALHIFGQVARFAPPSVEPLALPSWAYHATAAALTLAVDLVALWLVAAGGALRLAGLPSPRAALAYALGLTFALNSAYMLSYAPALGEGARAALLPWLDALFVIGLPLFIPISLYAVEGAAQQLEAAQLGLIVEAAALGGVLAAGEAKPHPQPVEASPEAPEAPSEAGEAGEVIATRNIPKDAPKFYTCRKCGLGGLTFAELGRHSRGCQSSEATAAD